MPTTTEAPTRPLPVKLLNWKSVRVGGLIGSAEILLGRDLVIVDVPIACSSGKVFAGMPSKPQIGRDGTIRRDDKGKILYTPVVRWEGRAARDRWSEAVLGAIVEACGAAAIEPVS
jgi:hypothetical protein